MSLLETAALTKNFSTHSFERLMLNDEKRLSMLRSFSKRIFSECNLKGKRVLELNATNITFVKFLVDAGVSSYKGLNFRSEEVSRLNLQNKENFQLKNVTFDVLSNDIKFNSGNAFNDFDLIVSFGFIESLSRFELFSFFKGAKDKLHVHSFMNNDFEFKNSIKRVFVSGFPMTHDYDYVASALSDISEWSILASKNFREYIIVDNL